MIYFKIQDTKGKTSWDLWSWSCSHPSLENGKMSFESICIQAFFTEFLPGAQVTFQVNLILNIGHSRHGRQAAPKGARCLCKSAPPGGIVIVANNNHSLTNHLENFHKISWAAIYARRELSNWSERELHDIGRSWSDVAYEADKPFWRA